MRLMSTGHETLKVRPEVLTVTLLGSVRGAHFSDFTCCWDTESSRAEQGVPECPLRLTEDGG